MKIAWYVKGELVYTELPPKSKVDIISMAGVAFIIAKSPVCSSKYNIYEFSTGVLIACNYTTKKAAKAAVDDALMVRTRLALKQNPLPPVNIPKPITEGGL